MVDSKKLGSDSWLSFSFWLVVATFLTFLIHELSHYFAGVALGFDMWVNLNGAGPIGDIRPNQSQQTIITMAGPIVTVIQASVAAIFIQSRKHLWGYSFVVSALLMRIFAFATSMAIYPNDEARVALSYGWPNWSIHAIIVSALLAATILAARKAKVGILLNLLAFFLVSASMAAIVLGSQAYPVKFG